MPNKNESQNIISSVPNWKNELRWFLLLISARRLKQVGSSYEFDWLTDSKSHEDKCVVYCTDSWFLQQVNQKYSLHSKALPYFESTLRTQMVCLPQIRHTSHVYVNTALDGDSNSSTHAFISNHSTVLIRNFQVEALEFLLYGFS